MLVNLSEATRRSGTEGFLDWLSGLWAVVDADDTDTAATRPIIFVTAHGILAVVVVLLLLLLLLVVVATWAYANYVG